MIARIDLDGVQFEVDLDQPLDVSIPLRNGLSNPNAWHTDPVRIEPVVRGHWIGEVKSGSPVNFWNIFFNPHGNGTHTECVGHISKEDYTINAGLKRFFFHARLVSIQPEKRDNGDAWITLRQLEEALKDFRGEALIIRTIPNTREKLLMNYSGTNPAYLQAEAAALLHDTGIEHLLVDLPSVDREEDGGKLLAHHAFWAYPHATRIHSTITEMVYVPDDIKDGNYLVNLQIGSFENDASPSKILLFRLKTT